MVPTPTTYASHSPRLIYVLASVIVQHVPKLFSRLALGGKTARTSNGLMHSLVKRDDQAHGTERIVFIVLIPVLVLMSGLFAGLTLGYMSLDETQLHVLSISGTTKQKEYAKKIQPIRKNGHLLLITLLLANMIVNETLPVISDPVLGGGVKSVVVSTVLIVIFSEIIPQSVCTRYGLAIGARMAWLVWILIFALGIVSWPVAKFLEFILGPHHGIMYRRAELKELINLHSDAGLLGGDLKTDTVTIIGATLDLQEKVASQIMTPLDQVFMLRNDTILDYDTMKKIANTGHSRVPVYEEVEVPIIGEDGAAGNPRIVKKVTGVLMVKQCLMLDPKEATPLKTLPLNKVLSVPKNEPLLRILDKFQEGRTHIAVISRFSVEKALSVSSVKQEVKKGLRQRLKARVGMADSSSSSSSDSSSSGESEAEDTTVDGTDKDANLKGGTTGGKKRRKWRRGKKSKKKVEADVEKGEVDQPGDVDRKQVTLQEPPKGGPALGTWSSKVWSIGREQSMPDDAVLGKDGARDFLQNFDPAVMPLGIITLEDVLEELIGEEIYDEFDPEGQSRLSQYVTPPTKPKRRGSRQESPVVASEGVPTAVAAALNTQHATLPPPHSPALSYSSEPPMSRKTSLGQSLGALVSKKKVRAAESGHHKIGKMRNAQQGDTISPDEALDHNGADGTEGVQSEQIQEQRDTEETSEQQGI